MGRYGEKIIMLVQIISNLLIGPLFLLLLIYLPAIAFLLIRLNLEINTSVKGVEVKIQKTFYEYLTRLLISVYAFILPLFLQMHWHLNFYEKGMTMAFVFGLFCGISTYFILYYFDPLVSEISRLQNYSGLNVFGEFTDAFDAKQIDSFRERILTSLNSEKRPLIVVCSSYSDGEGKSILAASLVKSFMRLHSKVLLMEIDPWCDLPNRFVPSSQRNNTLGISDYILNSCELSDTLYYPMEESFAVIPRGNKVDAPYEMLNSPNLLNAIERQIKEFSVIIIDAPTIPQFPELNRFFFDKGVLILAVSHHSSLKQLFKIKEFVKRFSLKNKVGLILTRNT